MKPHVMGIIIKDHLGIEPHEITGLFHERLPRPIEGGNFAEELRQRPAERISQEKKCCYLGGKEKMKYGPEPVSL